LQGSEGHNDGVVLIFAHGRGLSFSDKNTYNHEGQVSDADGLADRLGCRKEVLADCFPDNRHVSRSGHIVLREAGAAGKVPGANEPALSRLEQIDYTELWRLAKGMPEEWYQCDTEGLTRLIDTLFRRRSVIRNLINSFRTSSRDPFPNWKD